MKRFHVVLLIVACAGSAMAGEREAPEACVGGIVYHGLPEAAFKAATVENKLVFIWRLLGDLGGGC